MLSVFCKYLLKDASYRKRPLFKKHTSFNSASIGVIRETIGATGGSVEQFEIMAFFERRNNFLGFFCKYLLKDASYRKRPLFMKYGPLSYASIGGNPETIGVTGESVEQFEGMSFFETRNNVIRFLQISPNGRILQKKVPLYEIFAIELRIGWRYPETIGAKGEPVEQFEVMSFFERRNNFLCLLQISPKGRILQNNAPLYGIFAIKLRIDWWYSGNDRSYG